MRAVHAGAERLGGSRARDCAGTGTPGRSPTSRSRRSRPASSTSRWSSSARMTTAAGARPTTRASSTCARTCPARTSPTSSSSRGRRLEQVFRSLVAQGLQLHHRHVVRLHGPDGDRRRGIPGHHLPAPDRLQVERQELRQLLRRGRGHRSTSPGCSRARGRRTDGNPKIGYMATFPIPEELRLGNAIMRGAKVDLPRMHDGRPVHQHLARPAEGAATAAASLLRRRRRRRLHRRRHAGASPTSRRRRASGRSPTTTRRRARTTRCLDRAVLDLGSRVRPDRQAGQGQDLQGRLRVLRRRLEGDGPVRASWTARRRRRASPTCRRPTSPKVKDTLAKMLAGTFGRFDVFAGPIKDNTGKEILPPAPSSSSPTSTSSRPVRRATRARPACTGGPTASRELPLAHAEARLVGSPRARGHPPRPASISAGWMTDRSDVTPRPVPRAVEARGHRQGVPRRRRQRPRRLRPARRRDPRAARRERRRQEHAR